MKSPSDARPLSQIHGGAMNKRKESKMRETDRESRLMGRWTGIGFVIVVLGALAALLLLLGLG